MKNVDPELNAYCGSIFSSDSESDVPLPDDGFMKFLADRQLAGAAGALEQQVAPFDKAFAARFARFEKTPAPAHEADEADEVDAALLEKAATDPGARRTFNLREWIKKSLADGETVESLANYASGNGHHAMADEIRKAAVGL